MTTTRLLYDFQVQVVGEVNFERHFGTKRVIVVAPTGAGKTIVGSAFIRQAVNAYQDVLVLAHRREIIKQTAKKLTEHGIPHGIIQAGVQPRALERVQVASIQTLHARAVRSNRMELPKADVIILDECHHVAAKSYKSIIAAYPDAVIVGLTATPCRGDGRGLGGIFQKIVEAPQVAELIQLGYLVRPRVYAPINPDLKGVRVQAGDYQDNQLAERMDQSKLIGDIVTHWLKYGERRKTVCFAVNVAHSIHLRDEFLNAGVRAEHIDGTTPKAERDATLARLASGEIELVTNCMVLTEGWDMPEVGCCILARPTCKMGLYRQMIGRVLRPAPDKTDAIILDHSGAVYRHGLPEDQVEWTLEPDRVAESSQHAKRAQQFGKSLLECARCGAIREGGKACFHCGYLPPTQAPRNVKVADGELGLVDLNRRAKSDLNDPAMRLRWHRMLAAIAAERGYKSGWIAHQYRAKFGAYPSWGAVEPITPTQEVRSWVKSRQIAYLRARSA